MTDREKYLACHSRYNRSVKGKIRYARYRATLKGAINQMRCEQRRRGYELAQYLAPRAEIT